MVSCTMKANQPFSEESYEQLLKQLIFCYSYGINFLSKKIEKIGKGEYMTTLQPSL